MAKTPVLTVANWDRFQHYKDRCPPWIKLATDTFQNYDFGRLQDASKLLALCIWTLAARSMDGSVPADLDWIKRQGNLSDFVGVDNLKELIDNGYLIDASNMLASCYPSRARGEAEGEAETEAEGETETHNARVDVKQTKPVKQAKKDTPDELPATPKPRKAPLTTVDQHLASNPSATADWANYAASTYGWPQHTIDADLRDFLGYWRSDDAKGSGLKRDWAQTWRNRCNLLAEKRTRGVSPQRENHGRGPDRLTAILGASMATAMQRNGLASGERPREDAGGFGPDTGSDEAHLLPVAASS